MHSIRVRPHNSDSEGRRFESCRAYHHGQPILMTLLQVQCHQGFPGFLGSEIFLFFHWWQTPFSSDWQDPNRYLTVFQDLYMCYWMLEVKHEQVSQRDKWILNWSGRNFWEIKGSSLLTFRRDSSEKLRNQTGVQESAGRRIPGQRAGDVPQIWAVWRRDMLIWALKPTTI